MLLRRLILYSTEMNRQITAGFLKKKSFNFDFSSTLSCTKQLFSVSQFEFKEKVLDFMNIFDNFILRLG